MKTSSYKLLAVTAMILSLGVTQASQAEDTGAAAASAHPAIDLSILGGVDFAMPSLKALGTDLDKSTKAGFQGGLGANYYFSPEFSVELDVFYAQRAFTVKGTPDSELKLNTIQVPLLARYWVIPSHLGIGVGPYWSEIIGDAKVNDVSVKPGDAGFNRPDFGVLASVQGRYPVAQNLNVLLDARFSYGLLNQNVVNNDDNSYKQRDLTVLAGLAYSL